MDLNTRWLTQDERNTKSAERPFHTRLAEALSQHCWW